MHEGDHEVDRLVLEGVGLATDMLSWLGLGLCLGLGSGSGSGSGLGFNH